MDFKVTIHYEDSYGFVGYSEADKKLVVKLPDTDKKKVVEEYFSTEHVIRVAQDGLMTFVEKIINPLQNLENFKIALTQLWNYTGVMVDWSHPVIE